MTDAKSTKTPEREKGGGRGFGPGGGMHGAPVAKPSNFKESGLRLLATLKPERAKIIFVMVMSIVSVAFSVAGPWILGQATNVLFAGVVGQQFPAGTTTEAAIAGLNAQGETKLAEMVSKSGFTPGVGVDFEALARILILLAAVYLLSALFGWLQGFIMAGVAQRTVYTLRRNVDLKLARLPLKYFDDHSRGDILSRVTNDIDNIANTLQQTLTQIITAVFTIIGIFAMMIWISPLLAAISLLTRADVDRDHHHHRQTVAEAVRCSVGAHRQAQRPYRGDAHRTQHREGVRAPGAGDRAVRRGEREALRRELQGAVHLGNHHAGDHVRREPQLRRDRGHRWRSGRLGNDVARRRPGVHPVLAPVHVADRPDREHRQRDAVGGRLGRARLRAARRSRGEARRR